MSSSQDSIDQIPEAPQIPANNVVPLTTRRMVTEEVAIQLEEVTKALEDLKKEIASRKENAGGSMGDAPYKDYIDRKTSEIESKNKIDRIKIDAKFEKLVSDSDIKFEKLMGEMNTKLAQSESTHTKWMVGVAFSLIAFTMATIGVATNLILKAIPSSQPQPHQSITPLQSQDVTKQPPHDFPPSSLPKITNQSPTKKAP